MTSSTTAGAGLLRFLTAGSVDDGKSTLVGRLLYDSKSILDDQLRQIERTSRQQGDAVDLSLVTDGLRAEREQKITIDVAYRYFATPRRRFLIADTPGHVEYTRNMITGASNVDAAVILIDVTKGVLTQSRRHAFIVSLLGIRDVIVTVNKMDLAGYDKAAYDRVVEDFAAVAAGLNPSAIRFIPTSATLGDNVVSRSANMPWYSGEPLLEQLETLQPGRAESGHAFRFPVQYIIRPNQEFRGFAGTVASGAVKPGDAVTVLPSGKVTHVKSIVTAGGDKSDASAGEAVVLTTTEELDISRGDLIVHPNAMPASSAKLDADLCWMHDQPLVRERPYILLHTTRQTQAYVSRIEHRVDMATLEKEPAETLAMNDIGRVEIVTARAIQFDPYQSNRTLGSFVLIDPQSNLTVAAGMLAGGNGDADRADGPAAGSKSVRSKEWNIPRQRRELGTGHRAAVVWLTGVPAAGKTTIARALEQRLFDQDYRTMLLDGDDLRHGLCRDLGYSPAERAENIRRAGEVARLFFDQGSVVLCAFVSPYRADRAAVRKLFPVDSFIEAFVTAPLERLMRRDPKGLYAQARRGDLQQLTGVGAPYEPPEAPEITLHTDECAVSDSVDQLWRELEARGILRRRSAD